MNKILDDGTLGHGAAVTYEQLTGLAIRLKAEQRFLEAATAYTRAGELRPDSKAWLFAGLALRDGGEVAKGLGMLALYARDHPEDVDGWVSLGVSLKRQKRWGEAATAFGRALALRSDVVVRNACISCLWRDGKIGEARVLGLRNLREKDAIARQSHAGSALAGTALRDGGRGFDPEDRRRNVVAFSLWGDRPEYVTGAIVNAQIIQHVYVGWTARFYCDRTVPEDARGALRAYGAQVVMMDHAEHGRIRPMWRFLAADDPGINVFVCRDTDSRLNPRELLAVQDWLSSGRRFHVMRDHVLHHELILAGMWGGMAGVLPSLAELMRKAPQHFDNKFGDQAFLAEVVWPLIREDTKVHDTHYGFPTAEGFPEGIELPGQIHVGGGVKTMPHWSRYVQMAPVPKGEG
ncbi:UDP-N-acetylglucosamine--peptide N-acetylglucosaminyltransferase-like protein [Oceanicola sp. S124]|uniref:UDP-N-acetylglucosamine--peptide N-acetylglucosaminyltransferase-like protein n=1 Tax=Oceanicola sp. S124 TaxID=1042378 RepID=UPI0002558231|nr:UDP-N-acetylglucosamine--peptide N-acetylglucosaminyltransferase-like protein [Oceanicola sp. S124]